MQVDELVFGHEDSTWQLALSSWKTGADFILTSGGIRAMTESGAVPCGAGALARVLEPLQAYFGT